MPAKIINFNGEPSVLKQIIAHLNNQQPIIIPTDTQWGICATDPHLVNAIKQRMNKDVIQLVDKHYLKLFANAKNEQYAKLYHAFVDTFWPGQVTIIYHKISYRRTNAKYLNTIIDNMTLPIFCSSANITSCLPIKNVHEAQDIFNPSKFDILIVNTPDFNANASHVASTIIDINTFTIMRKGAKIDKVEAFIKHNVHFTK